MTTPIFGYSGVGKSTYANDFPAIAKDMQQGKQQTFDQFMLEVGKTIQSGEYKYVFLPCDPDLINEFIRRSIAFVAVLPYYMPSWVKRWLKAGDSAEAIKRRVNDCDDTVLILDGCPIAYLNDGEWIGNVLSQYGNTDAKKEEQ